MLSLFRRGFVLCICLCVTLPLHAQQRKYVVGTTVDLVSGGTNNPTTTGISLGQTNQPVTSFYSLYPSINATSTGEHSLLNFSYTFGFNRTNSQPAVNSESHGLSVKFSSPLNAQWKISTSESFQLTSDTATFNALRGVTSTPEAPNFLFNPVATNSSSRSNNASIAASYAIDDKSTLSLTASNTRLNYGQTALAIGGLSNQQNVSGSVGYSRKTGTHESWSLTYADTYFTFVSFQNTLSQTATVGYSNQIGRDLMFQQTVGISQVKSLGSAGDYVGYNMSASLQKNINNKSFSVSYTQTSGQPSGLGAVSDNRRLGFNLGRTSKRVNVFADASAFDSKGSLANTMNLRGIAATGSIGAPLTKTLSIQGGAQFQKYSQAAPFAFTQKRIFVSLKYNDPNFWRFSH
jgi:hypothetical protein